MKIFIAVTAVFPFAYLVYNAVLYSVNIPSYDEWYYIPMFEKMFVGTLTFNDLWATVNEHRLVIPKLIMLMSVRFTNWNINYLVCLNLILGVGVFFVIFSFLRREAKFFAKIHYLFLLPAISILLFSLVQYENWLWGVQTLIFVNELAVLVGLYYLTEKKVSHSVLIFAGLAAIFASLSHLAGLLFWPIGLLTIILNRNIKLTEKKRISIAWFLISMLLFSIYFMNYSGALEDAASVPEISYHNFIEVLSLSMAILGSPFELVDKTVSSVFGLVGLMIFSMFYLLAKGAQKLTNFHLFLLAMCLYGLASSVMTAIGRVTYEPPYIASRYSSFPTLFWISIVILIFSSISIRIRRSVLISKIGIFFLLLILILSINGASQGTDKAITRSNTMKAALKGFFSEPYPANLNRISTVYPRMKNKNGQYVIYLPHVVQKLDILSRYHLSFFND